MMASENLIDFSVDSSENEIQFRNPPEPERKSSATPSESGRMENQTNIPTKSYDRLCGFLNKLGNRPILNTFRKRWFVFNESNCKLYYFRNSNDPVMLGEIDISQATFTFDVSNKERPGLFSISVPGRDYFLEANSRKTALFWLQELQKYRRVNSLERTRNIRQSTNARELKGRPQSGLLADNIPLPVDTHQHVPLMSPIACPIDEIGDETGSNVKSTFSTAQQRLNSFVKSCTNIAKIDATFPESTTSSDRVSPSKSFSSETDSGNGSKYSKSSSHVLLKKLSSSFKKNRVFEEDADDLNTPENCITCQKLKKNVEELKDSNSNLQYEVSTGREVLSLLQRQLDIVSKEKDTMKHIYELKNSDATLDLISEKDSIIVNLTHDNQECNMKIENFERNIMSLKQEASELKSNNELFQEMLIQKDKTIMSLTNEVFELETDLKDERIRSGSGPRSQSSVEIKDSLTSEDLHDAVQALEMQNTFLNNEILELNQLRKDSEERVQLLTIKCSEWEARSYQIQSKLLFLLNELNKNGGENFNRGIVEQLLEESVGDGTTHTSILPSWSRDKMYDDLGFNWRWGKDDLLTLKASNLKQKSEDLTQKGKDSEFSSWRTKWDNFDVSLGSKELIRSPELKMLVRTGIPNEYRGKIWRGCIYIWIKDFKSLLGPDYYNSLLTSEEFTSHLDPASKQIELDLLRTLPNNRHYENVDSDGILKLRRVLLAYSRHDPVVGYCQGLNRLAAIALLFMDEEDSFWCLVAIIKFIMPDGYYTRTLINSHVDQKVLKELMVDKLPKIYNHFEQNNVDLSLFTFNWFLTVFVDNVPVDTYLRIWDVFLYEGSKVLFRYALAFFKNCENEILQIKDYLMLNKYLRNIAESCRDTKKLTNIAFYELNPFPQKIINSKRSYHFKILQAELEELENERRMRRSEDKVKKPDYMSEED